MDTIRYSPKRCDLCGGWDFELISRQDRRGNELLTDLCTTCGLVLHHRIPSEEELAAFYATEYRRSYHGEITPSPRRVMRAWKNGKRLFRELVPFLQPGTVDVFEVGAGIGCTVKVFEQNGYTASGIEPNKGFQRFADHPLRALVTNANLSDLPPVPRYDLILLVHVIEHLRSPRQSLLHVHQLLRQQGLLYVECPNLGAPFALRSRLFHLAHIYNFTPDTLNMLATGCGFSAERWLRDVRDPTIAVLMRRNEGGLAPIMPVGCQATRDALRRYNWITYHLRWSYLAAQVTKFMNYGCERLTAERYARRILAKAVITPAGHRGGKAA